MEMDESENKKFLMNYREEEGNTILHLIIATKDLKCLKALTRYSEHLDFRAKNDRGMTPLCYACSLKKTPEEMIDILASFDPDTVRIPDNKGFTPLHHVVAIRRLRLIELLLNHGANVDATNNKAQTPLHLSAMNCYDEIVHSCDEADFKFVDVMRYLLFIAGANPLKEDDDNRTPLDIVFNCLTADFMYKTYETYDFDDHPVVRCLDLLLPFTDELAPNYNFEKVFIALYMGLRSCSVDIVEFCIDSYYCDEKYNPKYCNFVRRFGELFQQLDDNKYYELTIMLHSDYPANAKRLRNILYDINEMSYSFFRIPFDEIVKSDEALDLVLHCLSVLNNNDIILSNEWFVEEIEMGFDIPLTSLSQQEVYRLFKFYEHIFLIVKYIDFNKMSMRLMKKVLQSSYNHCCDNIKYLELLFAFSSNVTFIDKIVESLYRIRMEHEDVFEHIFDLVKTVERLLPNEELQLDFTTYEMKEYKVMSLKQICRIKIREAIHSANPFMSPRKFLSQIMVLPIPKVLKKYLRFIDHNFHYLDFKECDKASH